jgi:hypothetical protein
VKDQDRQELCRLIPELLALLASVASGQRDPLSARDEYGYLHPEVRRILAVYGAECICPWPTVFGWSGVAAKSPDWQTLLAGRSAKARLLCGLDEPPPWTLGDYFRNGNENDTPFWSEFARSLEPHKQAILMAGLRRELAFYGPSIMDNDAKGHSMQCSGTRGSRTWVFMYKIREGAGQGEVQLRVFFVTRGDYTLVLLHGYDKGADLDKARELREAAIACERRLDVLRQRSREGAA